MLSYLDLLEVCTLGGIVHERVVNIYFEAKVLVVIILLKTNFVTIEFLLNNLIQNLEWPFKFHGLNN